MSSQVRYVYMEAEKCVEIVKGLLTLPKWDESLHLRIARSTDPQEKFLQIAVCGPNSADFRYKLVRVAEAGSWLDALLEAISACREQKHDQPDEHWPPSWIAGNGQMIYELTEAVETT